MWSEKTGTNIKILMSFDDPRQASIYCKEAKWREQE